MPSVHGSPWRWGAVALLLGLAGSALAQPGLVGAINAVRAAGCEGRRGLAAPLRASRALGEAARRLAAGAALAEALGTAGYRAMHAVSVHVEGDGDHAALAESVAHTACAQLLDRSLTDLGVIRSGAETWLILAKPFPSAALRDVGAVSRRVVALANAARTQPRRCGDTFFAAARPLLRSETLTRVAHAHSVDMAAHGRVAHEGSDGSKPSDRVARAGYGWKRVAENVASGLASPEEAMQGWLASPGHCANLMNPAFTETGAAFVVDPSSAGGVYWTQLFAVPER